MPCAFAGGALKRRPKLSCPTSNFRSISTRSEGQVKIDASPELKLLLCAELEPSIGSTAEPWGRVFAFFPSVACTQSSTDRLAKFKHDVSLCFRKLLPGHARSTGWSSPTMHGTHLQIRNAFELANALESILQPCDTCRGVITSNARAPSTTSPTEHAKQGFVSFISELLALTRRQKLKLYRATLTHCKAS